MAVDGSQASAGNYGSFGINGGGTVAYLHAGINPVQVAGLGTGGALNATPDPRSLGSGRRDPASTG